MLKIFTFFSAIFSTLGCFAAGIEFLPDGSGRIDNSICFSPVHYNEYWQNTNLFRKGWQPRSERNGDKLRRSGAWQLTRSNFRPMLTVEAEPVEDGKTRFLYRLESPEVIPTNSLATEFSLPVALFAGRRFNAADKNTQLPANTVKGTMLKVDAARGFNLPCPNGVLSVEFDVPCTLRVIDCRQFGGGGDNYTVRVEFPGVKSQFQGEATFNFRVKFEPYHIVPIDLAASANTGFTDETAGDGKGGWTDQGAVNDMRCLKPGIVRCPPGYFTILDSAKNGGRAAIVLGGGGRPSLPRNAEVSLSGENARTLLLLHSSAWTPAAGKEIGTIEVEYTDASTSRLPVITMRDVENWWNPLPVANGLVGWSGHNASAEVGLYLSAFPLENKPLRSLRFHSNGTAVWMIAAASLSPQHFTLPEPVSFVLHESADWKHLKVTREIEPGSALDFSFLLDAPAGKYGFLKVADDHFEFEKKNGSARFFGVNLCFSACFLEQAQSDRLAERLARLGYNAVRFHHFDGMLNPKGAKSSAELDPQQLDRLDYLVHALKQRGIYITFDLFTTRSVKPGEFRSFPELKLQRDYKLAAMLLPEVNANLKEFSRNLLTHVNPYTGLRWADDPVFIGISIINENTVYHIINAGTSDAIRKLFREKFDSRNRIGNITITDRNREDEFRRFLSEVYDDYYADMVKFLYGLGVRIPLTEQNFIMSPNLTRQRAAYDYVDNHIYWDHPTFIGREWALPKRYHNRSVITGRFTSPGDLAPTRVFGKPFTVTEFDFCRPNPFRVEGAPALAAFAAMQDWNALYRFAYSHTSRNLFSGQLSGSFDAVNDPIQLLSDRLAAAFFLRGDVKRIEAAFPIAVSPDEHLNYIAHYPKGAQELTFFGRVGSVLHRNNGSFSPPLPPETKAIYALDTALRDNHTEIPLLREPDARKMFTELRRRNLVAPQEAAEDGSWFSTPGGQFTADFAAGTFRAVTPYSEALAVPAGRVQAGNFLRAESLRDFSVTGAVALDGKPLRDSGRILVLHLSDVAAEGARYLTSKRQIMLADGDGKKTLAKRAVSRITLDAAPGNLKLYRLDGSGKRAGEIPLQIIDDKTVFTADTFAADGIVFAYELVRE